MAAAYRSAVQAGISPVEFWQLTPYLTALAIEALTDARYTAAWVQANLNRTRTMPKLEDLLKRKPSKTDMELRLKEVLSRIGSTGLKRAKRRKG